MQLYVDLRNKKYNCPMCKRKAHQNEKASSTPLLKDYDIKIQSSSAQLILQLSSILQGQDIRALSFSDTIRPG